MKKARRSAGTRTAWDRLKYFYLSPTSRRKKKDIRFMESGGELVVHAAFLPAATRYTLDHVAPGVFRVSRESVRWSGPRDLQLSEFLFLRGQWRASVTTRDPKKTSQVRLQVENVAVPSIHFQFRISVPDMDLLRAALPHEVL